MNWHAVSALATIAAVIVALFGNQIRARLWPPLLRISLDNATGVPSGATIKGEGTEISTKSRWYHIRVENERRLSPATDVRLLLLKFEDLNAAGQFFVLWVGEAPLQWRHQQVKPLTPTIGPQEFSDLCSVVQKSSSGSPGLALHPLIRGLDLTTKWHSSRTFAITLQARSIETDSNRLRVEIAWDGEWADDSDAMGRHLVIKTKSYPR
jgi:hypothetical protein